jgi:hypothetical protein
MIVGTMPSFAKDAFLVILLDSREPLVFSQAANHILGHARARAGSVPYNTLFHYLLLPCLLFSSSHVRDSFHYRTKLVLRISKGAPSVANSLRSSSSSPRSCRALIQQHLQSDPCDPSLWCPNFLPTAIGATRTIPMPSRLGWRQQLSHSGNMTLRPAGRRADV